VIAVEKASKAAFAVKGVSAVSFSSEKGIITGKVNTQRGTYTLTSSQAGWTGEMGGRKFTTERTIKQALTAAMRESRKKG
jgi:hypothetical protein